MQRVPWLKICKLWGLSVPPAAFIHVHRDHLTDPDGQKLAFIPQHISLEHVRLPLFGSAKLLYAKEVDQTFLGKNDHEISLIQKVDFLKIALFDIWLANEDRNANNFNLLLHSENDVGARFYFAPIDHEKIFNSGTINFPIQLLTFEDSIISSDIFRLLFPNLRSLNDEVSEIKEVFPQWISFCQGSLDRILADIPETWGLDISYLTSYLIQQVFSGNGLNHVMEQFLSFIQEKLSF